MGILIADSGSTKTEWVFRKDDLKIIHLKGPGMNPYFCSDEILLEIIQDIKSDLNVIPDVLHFYGAGCSSANQSERVWSAFKSVFPSLDIHVEHDLLAAARALCGSMEGIACILGTGSNSCHFDGKNIVSERPALGYILGDEGAGTQMGIALLKAYLYEELPSDLAGKFYQEFSLDKNTIVERVYKKDLPNRFLASFSPFILENKKQDLISELIQNVLKEFVHRHLLRYPDIHKLPVHFTGSIAYHFRQFLDQILRDSNIQMGTVLKSPMEGLMQYHFPKV